ncbi:hypothetical protein ScalyP_jg6724 [Parmales sp. scaly parma]|nr:hypothetical protein ScalyP_jg6724 [Parmales sp. scaly parma]
MPKKKKSKQSAKPKPAKTESSAIDLVHPKTPDKATSEDTMHFLTSSPKSSPPTKQTLPKPPQQLIAPRTPPQAPQGANMNSFLTHSPKSSPPCSSSNLRAMANANTTTAPVPSPTPEPPRGLSMIDGLFVKMEEENERRSRANSTVSETAPAPAAATPTPTPVEKPFPASVAAANQNPNIQIIKDVSGDLKTLSNEFYQEGVKFKSKQALKVNVDVEKITKDAKLALTRLLDKCIDGTELTKEFVSESLDAQKMPDGFPPGLLFDVFGQVFKNGGVHIEQLPMRPMQFHGFDGFNLWSGVEVICEVVRARKEAMIIVTASANANANANTAPVTPAKPAGTPMNTPNAKIPSAPDSPFAKMMKDMYKGKLSEVANETFSPAEAKFCSKSSPAGSGKASPSNLSAISEGGGGGREGGGPAPREDKKSEACCVS